MLLIPALICSKINFTDNLHVHMLCSMFSALGELGLSHCCVCSDASW